MGKRFFKFLMITGLLSVYANIHALTLYNMTSSFFLKIHISYPALGTTEDIGSLSSCHFKKISLQDPSSYTIEIQSMGLLVEVFHKAGETPYCSFLLPSMHCIITNQYVSIS